MKQTIGYLVFASVLLVASCSFTTNQDNPSHDKLVIEVITYLLEKEHYAPKKIDDDLSKKVFVSYLEMLDPYKRIFLKSDIQKLKNDHFKTIDDDLKKLEFGFFEDVYVLYVTRRNKYKDLYKEILKTPNNYEKTETIDVEYDSLPYPENDAEVRERWKKYLKLTVNVSLYDEIQMKKESLKQKKVSFEDLQKEAVSSIDKSMEASEKALSGLSKKEDLFVLYINAILSEFDPHTDYLSPDMKEDFDTSISGKFEGIGAILAEEKDAIVVKNLIVGGPAWKQKKLKAGDAITKVGQSDKEEPVSVVGMPLSDVIKMIRGPKESTVYLTIRHHDESVEVIPVERGIVEIEETYLKTTLINTSDGLYGFMKLPKFYVDFSDYEGERNAVSDMKKDLSVLNTLNARGVILDLRENGGGSLKAVVDMAGLFMETGPVVQVGDAHHGKQVIEDSDPEVVWDKPLVILVDDFSASSSEILAAAMQDYKRAIIIGSNQTYGKGTVQHLIDLNSFVRNSALGDLGTLKLTAQKFYRINGGSTQMKGVKSDISLPSIYFGKKEAESPNALPWDSISSTNYKTFNNEALFKAAISKSRSRIASDTIFGIIRQNGEFIKEQKDRHIFALNFETYKTDMKKIEDRRMKNNYLKNYKNNLKFRSFSNELKVKDTLEIAREENFQNELKEDPYVSEAFNVLKDLINEKTFTMARK